MKYFVTVCMLIQLPLFVSALTINEIMSNPTGDDGGREWIELYNAEDTDVDISSLTISIKGGAFIPVTPISGGTRISSHGYAIISSTVTGVSKFTQDYPSYNGPLFKSAMSLVNTGITSVELKSHGVTVDTIPSYTAAKEGATYSLINNGIFAQGEPTPGEENKIQATGNQEATTTQNGPQVTIAQMSPPSADIILYLPQDKTVVAGAPAIFSVAGVTRGGKMIEGMTYTWSFGDGGQKTGSSTVYRYLYSGRYIAQVEGANGFVAGTGRISVRVVSPDIMLSTIGHGKYGSYIDITNPNTYDLELSDWKLSLDGALFLFPKNTLLAHGTTRFSGIAMGFASTTITSDTIIKLLFQNMEEVVRIIQGGSSTPQIAPGTMSDSLGSSNYSTDQKQRTFGITTLKPNIVKQQLKTLQQANQKYSSGTTAMPTGSVSTSTKSGNHYQPQNQKKDTRIATFIRSLFGR